MQTRTRIQRIGVAALLATPVVVGGLAAPAGAASVLNRFERSCYLGCSPWVQVNGAYHPEVGSDCVTKSWNGTTTVRKPQPGARC
ncbi:hypothetical protein [Dactylosporangium matsuzakiense]|uniref:Uncharacterized protein n=1 Tax=Dactylosporangium matsuzakiense TaxID=53360 RepID=A0A9W6KZV9_9ACTN|nr:hypothetical protein [Dactylosporangium matsuzakiense]UWZ44631.1 hypothetical protein Dmats_46075 [Dactylosporangium matsuzakiense]GLL08514.1 hypothetical protein GCM10017581_102810 [Dactylosporangium matsuzakiense]